MLRAPTLRSRQGATPVPSGRSEVSSQAPTVAEVVNLRVDLRRNGKTVHALRGVDLAVGVRETVAIVGESGSGKSVFGLALLGLLPNRSEPQVRGSVTVMGVDMLHADEPTRRQIRRDHLGVVFQDPMTSLTPTMTIGRQLGEVTGSTTRTLELLEEVGLPDAADRLRAYPHELSGGQRQRVMIAVAVARKPSLIVADEPTTALDVTVQGQILDLLRGLTRDHGTSVLFASHDLGVAARIADRIAVVYAGRIVEQGPAEQVLTAPAHPYTRALLDARLTLHTDRSVQLPVLNGEAPDPTTTPTGCAFAERCSYVVDACRAHVPALRSVGGDDQEGEAACINPLMGGRQRRTDRVATAWPPMAELPGNHILELVDVRVSYRGGRRRPHAEIHALSGVQLRVRPGEAVGIVGESGSGKSTLLRVAAGLLKPQDGDVAVAGDAAAQLIFQDAGASLTPWLSIGALLEERLAVAGVPADKRAARVEETLRLVGLATAVRDARAGALSGGQRQRAAAARAVVVPPRLLLCDEPTSALDVSLAALMLNLIGRLRRQLGMALVFVTHDLAAARFITDRVLVMRGGRVVEQLESAQLATAAREAYTMSLLAAYPDLSGAVAGQGGPPCCPSLP